MKIPSRRNIIIKILLIIGLLITVISVYLLFSIETPKKPLAGKGNTSTQEVKIGGDFVLMNQHSKEFNSDELKGKFSLIYFGFTYCPDVCPTSLQKILEIMHSLDKYKIDINFVFITIDPQRDTPEVLKSYLKPYSSKIIGLTGSQEQIEQIARNFKVYFMKASDSEDYMVDHSSFLYLMNKNGDYLKHFYFDDSPKEIVEFVRINSKGYLGN